MTVLGYELHIEARRLGIIRLLGREGRVARNPQADQQVCSEGVQ